MGKKSTRTDARGRFLLAGISPEATTLVVEGASANTERRQYGRFDIRIHPRAGRPVDLGFPVWMTPLDTKHTVRFAAPAKTEVVLKTPSIPGLEVRIPKGSVVRDEKGRPVTELGITAIPLDRPPFPLPENSVVPVFFTVQPGGTYVFPKGAQVIYPNYTREAPGTEVEFMDYDPKKKGWYVYGNGRVSADGKQVVPDAKRRVWAFHGAMFNTGQLPPWLTSWLKDTLDWLSGDPVELSTGMLTDSRTDLAVSDSLGSAEVTRTYWQGDTYKRAFGIGRDLIYNSFLHSAQPYREVDLYLPGGAKVHYTRTSPGTGWNDAVFEPLDTPSEFRGSKIYGGNGRWEIRFRDGSIWTYPQYAPLQQIQDRHGNTLKISRLNGTKGDITQITTPGGRWISFGYDTSHRIISARDNTGRTTGYTYDTAGRLETVTDPAGKVSRYTYDGTTNRVRTAVDARGVTYMSNTFDAAGRVKEQTLTEDWLTQRLSGRKVNWGQVGSSAALGCLTGMLGGAGNGGKFAGRVDCKNSFTGDTPVLMADGTRKPIKDVRVGDKVLATDPETGESGPREVSTLIQGSGDKALTDITVAAATEDGRPAKITATDGHPFWLPEVKEWTDAGDLRPGQWLRTSSGTWAQITAISHRTRSTAVYNLTVDDLHTYYALAGATPVLVHNSGLCDPPLKSLHPDSSLDKSSLDFWGKQDTEDILFSLRPGAKEALRVKPDGTIANGNTRIKVLRDRGYDVDSLPREPYGSSRPMTDEDFWNMGQ
ncbi:Rhs-family protein [Streptomyces sp. L-9-10]|uniref:polymorphic toxin-type HINT domain-containing protein n=1 Tax=Streptomyces sp. L-9-10 TaxID=1478131 RepID=UPI00101BE6FF|nr:polymorphic toxin-type HINT domain-containing protein [Streptomyces sp. L-9-10]RYJ22027.1 Rhs-family protein [Streptomyces sp. L-9-10]